MTLSPCQCVPACESRQPSAFSYQREEFASAHACGSDAAALLLLAARFGGWRSEKLWVALRYVEENPVRALMVGSPELYEWSSAAPHLEVAPERVPLLDMEFWEQAGGEETWRRLHGRPTPVEELRLLRRCTYAGRPFGEAEFVEELEERFHRRWRRWGFELATADARG